MSENSQIPHPSLEHAGSDFPDIFLSYNSLDRGSVEVVRRLLKQRGVVSFFDRENLRVGEPWIDALESALNRVRAVAVFVGKDGLGTWQKREMSFALDRQARDEKNGKKFPVIPVLLPQTDLGQSPGFLLLGTWVDLRATLEDPAAIDALARAAKGEPSAPVMTSVALPPYRALQSFREEDAQLFFGREVFVEDLLNKALSRPFVAVLGPSGSGKSSVVQAGLFPLLRRQRPPASTWDIITFLPGKRPFHNLAGSLVSAWAAGKSKTDILIEAEKLGNSLAKGEVRLEESFNLAMQASSGTDRLLLVIDQFEELFTLTPETERLSFISSLFEATSSSPVTILITMRADFYGQALALSRVLSDAIQQGVVNLGPMKRDELRRSIIKPAESVGLRFEPGLVERILDHVENQPGNLPLLEYALTELWGKREGILLSNQQYDAIGGVEGAITQRAESLFEGLSSEQKLIAARTFTRLVRVSAANEEGTDSRQRVKINELDDSTSAVMRSFVSARLLVVDRNPLTNEEIVEVAHEALISGWKRLREWVDKDREFLLWRQRLGFLVDQWQQSGREEGALLRGFLLQEARQWLSDREKDLNKTEREFIVSSSRQQATVTRWRRGAVAAALIVIIAAAGGIVGWNRWKASDAYQIKQVMAKAPSLVASSDFYTNREWFVTLTFIGKADDALTAARQIQNIDSRDEAFQNIAASLAQLGKIKESYAVTNELTKQEYKAWAFGEIALKLAERKQVEQANAAAAEAVAALKSIEDMKARQSAFEYTLLDSLLKLGMFDQALAITNEIVVSAKDDRRYELLDKISKAFAEEGRLDEAYATALMIKHPDQRVETFTDLAKASVKLNRIDTAKRAATEALTTARTLTQSSDHVRSLTELSVIFASIHDVEKAKGTAEEALNAARNFSVTGSETQWNKAKALSEVADAFTKLHETERAKTIANEARDLVVKVKNLKGPFDSPFFHADELVHMIVALARMGRLKEALDLPLTPDEDARSTYRDASISLLSEGMLDDSVAVIRAIREPQDRVDSFIKTARLSLNIKNPDAAKMFVREALATSREISEDKNKAHDLVSAAEVLFRLGEIKEVDNVMNEARMIAAGIGAGSDRAGILSRLAGLNAKLHRYRTALELADECSDLPQRLTAYTVILQAYSKEHDPVAAKLIEEREKMWNEISDRIG